MTTKDRRYTSLHHRLEQAIARGETTEQICAALGVTPVTVDEARDRMDALCDEADDEEAEEPLTQVLHPDTSSELWSPTDTENAAPVGDTPGYAALAEAMRLEQARIYGQMQREFTQPVPAAVADARVYEMAVARRRRRSA